MSEIEIGHAMRWLEVERFLKESLAIEGIHRPPTKQEIESTLAFLDLDFITLDVVCIQQAVYAPDMPLRVKEGMNVRVGSYLAPTAGPAIGYRLAEIIDDMHDSEDPWLAHVEFELLHPFLDGNGRMGRTLWAWHMKRLGRNPFALSFLHRWYYQTLDHMGRD